MGIAWGESGDGRECERSGGLWRARQIALEDFGDSLVRRADERVYMTVAQMESLPFRITVHKVTRSELEIAHPSLAQRNPLNVFGLIWQLTGHPHESPQFGSRFRRPHERFLYDS